MTGPRIAAGELNYDGIGSTEHGPLPPHLELVITRAYLGEGPATYRRVAQGILTWRLQKGAGLRVRAESEVVVPGTRVVSGFGIGPFRINAPCEVVWVHRPLPGDGPQSAGFGYGTLPGHPVRGEEAFEVEIDGKGRVTIAITAFGAPSNWYYAAGGALTNWARRRVTSRYIESAHQLAAGES
ncbi:uncharacterized protein (UPF0548 family) [Arthrobacter sp. V4I6]|uniref:DUF1990 family protein n=1 Tax=unclassified Arthrobacter TaxID=235627 RepID=UPI0027846867|nr:MULTISPECIES: DUF1990 domain-containing protein [unclassified Arthrobacter]MDQ0822924.1 uncharacterized protein (UPF0548 family) [Arthrobacter sp. V1I7]MDQ0852553.1 uncharacterized protein (UPF0548 family) [Arthrobacter sp. V4I6]